MRALWACVCQVRHHPDFSVQLAHCTGLFIVFLGHAASLCPLKVRGFTFVSTANRSIVAYDSSMATGTPLLKSVCLCCCRKLNGSQVQSTKFCFSARRRHLECRLLLL